MNIAFDAAAVLGPMSKNRGIGNYTLSQIKNIINQDRNNGYFLFNCYEKNNEIIKQLGNIKEEFFYLGDNNLLSFCKETREIYSELLKKFLKNNSIDIFYITSPFDTRIPPYEKEWFGKTKVVMTVYDIIPWVFKSHYLKDQNSIKWYKGQLRQLEWVDIILVISESVKDDLIKYLNIPAEKIKCIWGAVDKKYKVLNIGISDRVKLFNKYNLRKDYIMCTGGDDERKNIAGLIEAYSKLDITLRDRHQLVIVCKLSDAAVCMYTELAKRKKVENQVVFTNYVPDHDLIQLYNLAYLMAFPSKYEGFGLPVVEAFACDTAVLTSNNSSLVQIAGDAAYLCDPFSINSIKEALEAALTDDKIDEKIIAGRNQVQKFQWEKVASETLDAIKAMEYELKENKDSSKKKLAFFTPLPPLESGISDYSVDIIRELSEYFDIDVFVDDGYVPVDFKNNGIKIYNHNKYCKNNYYDTVYQFGNSAYHIYMIPYIKRYSGTLVLHDVNLHGMCAYRNLYMKAASFEDYYNDIKEDLTGQNLQDYINQFRSTGKPDYSIIINGFVTNYANKIIVHSEYAMAKLLEKDISYNVNVIPSYAVMEGLVDTSIAKHKINVDNGILIAAFGHIHNTKRVLPILNALAMLKKEYSAFKFVFCGKLDSSIETDFKETLNKFQLNDYVQVTGYVDLGRFLDLLDATDICLNLRYPYNGETSGSLMRMLAKGKCIIINDIGAFSELPDDVCMKLPSVDVMSPSEEVHEIYNAMKKLIDDHDLRNKYSVNARRFAEQNLDLIKVARLYLDCITDDVKSVLDEKLLITIKKYLSNENYSIDQVRKIAKTLAYLKS